VRLEPAVTAAGAVLVIAISAVATTVAVDDALLFPGVGSVVAEVTVAVFVIVEAFAAAGEMLTATVSVAVAPTGTVTAVHVIVPVAPAGGVVQVKAGPDVCVWEANVVLAGSVSVKVTLAASDGPLFVTVSVYVAVMPAVAVGGPLFVTARSAAVVTIVVAVDRLFAVFVSPFESLMETLFDNAAPAGTLELIAPARVKVALAPAASVVIEQVTVPFDPTAGDEQVAAGPVA
jgi:hypothetical protein